MSRCFIATSVIDDGHTRRWAATATGLSHRCSSWVIIREDGLARQWLLNGVATQQSSQMLLACTRVHGSQLTMLLERRARSSSHRLPVAVAVISLQSAAQVACVLSLVNQGFRFRGQGFELNNSHLCSFFCLCSFGVLHSIHSSILSSVEIKMLGLSLVKVTLCEEEGLRL